MGSTLLGVHLDQSQLCPDPLNKVIQTRSEHDVNLRATMPVNKDLLQAHLTADNDRVVLVRELVHLLQADRIYFVVDI
jgi:hypothetical protein